MKFKTCLTTLPSLNQCPCYCGCSTYRRNTDFIGIICSLESTSYTDSKVCGLCKAVVPNMGSICDPPQGKPNKSEQPAMVIKGITYFLNKFRLILFFISFHFFLVIYWITIIQLKQPDKTELLLSGVTSTYCFMVGGWRPLI